MIIRIFLFFLLFMFPLAAIGGELAGQVESRVKTSVNVRQKTQKEDDKWAAEKAVLIQKYKGLLSDQEELVQMNNFLKEQIAFRKTSISILEKNIQEAERISQELLPFLRSTLDRLRIFIKDDIPFNAVERMARLNELAKSIENPKKSVSEKFRKLMDFMTLELEYGRSIDVYEERIKLNDQDTLVNILRIGRLSIFCRTFDLKTVGVFDPAKETWSVLPGKYRTEINKAIEIAQKRRTIELVALPFGKLVIP